MRRGTGWIAAYGVEIRRSDGRKVEVNLDKALTVIAQESDDDTPGRDGSR